MQTRVIEERIVKIGLDAEDVVRLLYKHHPGERQGSFVGRWTCIREWCGIDLLALDAWQASQVIGYEVKVSRSDMRSELLSPFKRAEAVSRCNRFYFAVPEGLLKPEEIAFDEPDWSPEDFERAPCPGIKPIVPLRTDRYGNISRIPMMHSLGGPCRNPRQTRSGRRRSGRWVPKHVPKGSLVKVPVPVVIQIPEYASSEHEPTVYDVGRYLELQGTASVVCPTCGGTGYSSKSRVELEGPMLWVPKDVGLVEVSSETGVRVVKPAPVNKTPKPIIGDAWMSERIDEVTRNRLLRQGLNELARWCSNRPDPRHR